MITFLRSLFPTHTVRLNEFIYKYFLNVLAVTATLSANSIANGSAIKVGWRLNGNAR